MPIKERVNDLINKMTLEEKVGQILQLNRDYPPDVWVKDRTIGSYLNLNPEEIQSYQKMALSTRLGIPLIFAVDAIHGHCFVEGTTIFPSPLGMSSSWNPELIETMAGITAKEMSISGYHWNFSPVLCLGRDSRWGRIGETFGEDPYLVGQLGKAMVKGYQGNNLSDKYSVLACAKHFIAYGETIGGRDSTESEVSERKIRSLFLPPFKEVFKENCGSVMVSYQSIDGTPASANKWLLKDILRSELDFKGLIITDWDNLTSMFYQQKVSPTLKDAVKTGLLAGNNVIMSTEGFYDLALDLVKKEDINESVIDESCYKILEFKFKLGLFDQPNAPDENTFQNKLNIEKHKEAALKLAIESMVLLKNENKILPLKENLKIAVIGPNADNEIAQLGDWSFGNISHWPPKEKFITNNHKVTTILEGIQERVKGKGDVLYSRGCGIFNEDQNDISNATSIANQSDVIIAVVGDTIDLNGERKDRSDLNLSGSQLELLKSLKTTKKPLIVILVNGKPLTISWIEKNADAILESWNSGSEGGKAVASIIFGDTNPSGKLTISFPRNVGQIPVYYNQLPGWHGDKYVDLEASPLYPFGFGLSYTTFKYQNLRVNKTEFNMDEIIHISIDVSNIGLYKGEEVVQLYINDIYSSVTTPIKELKGFQKVMINSTETKEIRFNLPVFSLSLINRDNKQVVEPGVFEIMIGSSSLDRDLLKTEINILQ